MEKYTINMFLFLALFVCGAMSSRVLDEVIPVDPTAPSTSVPVGLPVGPLAPTTADSTNPPVGPVAPTTTDSTVPPVGPVPPTIADSTDPPVAPVDTLAQPLSNSATTTTSAATTTSGGATSAVPPVVTSKDAPLTFFMHDIIGGTNPSARVVTGVVTNSAVNGQIPFGKPNGANLPVNNGIPLNGANNGIINNNNVPFLTGLGGTTSTFGKQGGANGIPFFTGGNLPAGGALEKLLFGTMTVIDDELTEGHELGSTVIGKAQGFYIASSEDGNSQTMAFTTLFKEGEYADSLSFFGVHMTAVSESHVAVVGGTGKYVNAKGFATLQIVPSGNNEATDGMETIVQFTVYLV